MLPEQEQRSVLQKLEAGPLSLLMVSHRGRYTEWQVKVLIKNFAIFSISQQVVSADITKNLAVAIFE
jgi:hypothetical protein